MPLHTQPSACGVILRVGKKETFQMAVTSHITTKMKRSEPITILHDRCTQKVASALMWLRRE